MSAYDGPIEALRQLNADIAQRRADQLQELTPPVQEAEFSDPSDALRLYMARLRDEIGKDL
jgi:hypothetical protein